MVVSATRMKSSAGESCTPLGNRNWSSKTFTSLVSVSYSSRLWMPIAKGHTGRVHDCPAGWEPCSPLGRDLQKGTQPYTRMKAPGGPLLKYGSQLVSRGSSPSTAAPGIPSRHPPVRSLIDLGAGSAPGRPPWL